MDGVRVPLDAIDALSCEALPAAGPAELSDAADLFDGSAIARAAFGDEMVDHYVHQARIEVEAYDAAVTDWERVRGFERL